ncbi:MAG: hypothetical protein R3200_09980 [Xanthomonadales bacterium]|nr:hypothetical protein [Xanthomonadales bacterium]
MNGVKALIQVLALAWAASSAGAEPEAPDFFKSHLESRYGPFPVETTIVDFARGDVGNDGREEFVGVYRNSFTIAPSESTGGKRAKQHQTMIAVFVPGPDGLIYDYEDDTRLRWCEGDACFGVTVTDEGQIEVRQHRNAGDAKYESILTLSYADGKFSPVGPPQDRLVEAPEASEEP